MLVDSLLLCAALLFVLGVGAAVATPAGYSGRWRRTEIWVIFGILLVAFALGSTVGHWHTGLWPNLVQFMLGGWPNNYETALSSGQVVAGVVLQAAFTFGLPALLVTVLYRQLTRSVTMRIIDYIGLRDQITATQIYTTYRNEMRKLLPEGADMEQIDRRCWELASEAMARIRRELDDQLPPQAAEALHQDSIPIAQPHPDPVSA